MCEAHSISQEKEGRKEGRAVPGREGFPVEVLNGVQRKEKGERRIYSLGKPRYNDTAMLPFGKRLFTPLPLRLYAQTKPTLPYITSAV